VGNGYKENGVTYDSPLWEWSDGDVYAYLKEQSVMLPDHYGAINDSLDCWICSAHLAHHGDEKMRYIREHYPDLWPIVADRVSTVRSVLASELRRIHSALSEVQ